MADAAFSAVYILFAILAFPSLITLLNVLTISVCERTRKIAMIRAGGGRRKQILNIVLGEAILLTAIETTFGIVGGLYLGYYFFLTGILAAIVITAIIPARQAARLEIIQALRYE